MKRRNTKQTAKNKRKNKRKTKKNKCLKIPVESREGVSDNTDRSIAKSKKLSVHKKRLSALSLKKNTGPSTRKALSLALKDIDGSVPIATKQGLVLAITYQFTLTVIKRDKISKVKKKVKKLGYSKGKIELMAQNPFRLCMYYLCDSKEREVKPATVHKWAMLLHYAALHHVKSEDLLGFLYQEGSIKVINTRYRKLMAPEKSDV